MASQVAVGDESPSGGGPVGPTGPHSGGVGRPGPGRQGGETSGHAARTPLRIWFATAVIILGFAVGGLGLIVQQTWLIWTGVGVVVVGAVMAKAFGIMENTE